MSKLFEKKLGGIGWYAMTVLLLTGIYMLWYRGTTFSGLFSADFFATTWGKILWAKFGVVLILLALESTVGSRPSKWVHAYQVAAFAAVGLSVLLVRLI